MLQREMEWRSEERVSEMSGMSEMRAPKILSEMSSDQIAIKSAPHFTRFLAPKSGGMFWDISEERSGVG